MTNRGSITGQPFPLRSTFFLVYGRAFLPFDNQWTLLRATGPFTVGGGDSLPHGLTAVTLCPPLLQLAIALSAVNVIFFLFFPQVASPL